MKTKRLAKILLITVLLISIALFAVACGNEQDYSMTFIFKGIYADPSQAMTITINAKAGEEITPPAANEVSGKEFRGWYTNESCEGDTVTPPSVMPDKNTVYYGIYVDKGEYPTLTFIANGQNIGTISQAPGTAITVPTPPQLPDKTFIGWKLNNTGDIIPLSGMPAVMPSENATYHAVYRDEAPTIPDNYNLKFTQNDEDNHLYIAGEDVYIEYDETVIKSVLTKDGNYAEFSHNQHDYCIVLDYDSETYGVYEYAMDKNAYLLYVPIDDTFNHERILYFEDNSSFSLKGYTYDNLWADGTYSVFNPATDEFDIKVVHDNTYGLFGDCRIRLTKRVRQSEDTGAKPVIYNAYTIFDASVFGSYYYNNQSLMLDGYGFATYTDANGTVSKGVCETTEVDGFSDEFISFKESATGQSSLFIINVGDDKTTFVPIGKEVGIYRIFDVSEQLAGSYYLLLNGSETAYVFYGERTAFYPETEIAQATYTILESGEIEYTLTEISNETLMNDTLRSPFRFKLTTYGAQSLPAFVIYDEALAGVWSAENGASSITFDGYGGAVHNDGGNLFAGNIQIHEDLLLISASDESQRIFRFTRSDNAVTYRQIGLEIGNYTQYSYIKGLKETVYVHFDGEGRADLYAYDEAGNKFVIQKSGTYVATDVSGEFEITFSATDKFKVATRQINFGTLYEPNWKTVFIEFDASMAGTFTNAAGTATIVLDGYGLKGVYTDEKGAVYTGEFAKEWNLITFLTYDNEGYTGVMTFKITGNIFEIKTGIAGVYYAYDLYSDIISDYKRIFIDGDGNAHLSEYDKTTDSYIGVEATYTYNAATADYTLNPQNREPFRFILTERGENKVMVYIIFDENWKGSYVDEDDRTLVLDGYGNAVYRDETVQCTVFGTNSDAVTFNWYGEKKTFILDKTNNTFAATDKPIGIYLPYTEGTISGYTRLIINADGTAELYAFSNDSNAYELINRGTYAKNGDIYTFTSTNGAENFKFKLSSVGGYDVYRTQDDYASTLTGSVVILGENKTLTLILDGYGSATLNFFDEKDGSARTRTGYYSYSETEKLLVFIATNEYGQEYATYIIEVDWDANSFEILSEQ